ncbi:uncharacterized protein LOC143075750 [Mytilus galloprovincialis]|uniref:uncharacterized protein LOC143075750 n=1 Tax=Mytilus galloprovincialis TaxID=29158 RepID=UPI003F7BE633
MMQMKRQNIFLISVLTYFIFSTNGGQIFDREKNINNNLINIKVKKEFLELRIAFKGILVLETSAFQNSSYELKFRQLTNGRDLIQLLLQNGLIKDCEYSKEPKRILQFIEKFSESDDIFKPETVEEGDAFNLYHNSVASNGSSAIHHFHRRKELKDFRSFVKIKKAMKLCNEFVRETLEQNHQYNSFQYIRVKNGMRRDGRGVRDEHEINHNLPHVTEGGRRNMDNANTEHHRRKRALVNQFLMFPGTKWCGRGQTALHYDDIGDDRDADVCCRDHDCCPDLIPSFSTKYNYFNYRFHAILQCECDDKFRSCLKQSYSPMASFIGRIYFNIMGSKCFTLKKDVVCAERSWWGYCLRYDEEPVAQIKSQESFNCF